jgi:periplasmic protein TonB
MKFSFDWSSILNSERREIVFENRNRNYGGYVLRKNYSSIIVLSLTITISVIGLAVIVPLMISYLSGDRFKKEIKMTEGVNLEDPPPIDKTSPPPPPVIPPPPVVQTIKFTPPKVVKDEEVEEPPPTQEEIKNERVGTETKEGLKDVVDLPPDLGQGADDDQIFTVVEEMPSFPGGEKELFKYLSHIRYPAVAREGNVSGWVYLNFIIDKDGKVKDAQVIKGIGSGCDEEALRVVLAMPEWRPGRQNGRNVQVRSNIRVNFSLK